MSWFRPTLTSLDDRYAPSAGFTDPTPLSEYDARSGHEADASPTVDLTAVPEWSATWLPAGPTTRPESLGPKVD